LVTVDMANGVLLADHALAQRVETADMAVGMESARIHAALEPASGAVAEAFAGGIAVFVGVNSPLTQALGIGMQGPVRAPDIDDLEEFFIRRGSAIHVELCPLADASVLKEIAGRGYRVMDFSNMMVRRIRAGESTVPPGSGISVQFSGAEDAELWARTVAAGFGDQQVQTPENLAVLRNMLFQPATRGVLAWVDGRPAGGGAMSVHDGVAAIYGASTVPSFRRLGVQSAVIRTLMNHAAEAECDLAYTLTRPGSVSQRNLERQGFRVAYTRTTLVREHS
jgi:ribosomal protein S18 acetylase RimI-like enzyme